MPESNVDIAKAHPWLSVGEMIGWTAGWLLRHLAMGLMMGMGAWGGFALLGAKIVCN